MLRFHLCLCLIVCTVGLQQTVPFCTPHPRTTTDGVDHAVCSPPVCRLPQAQGNEVALYYCGPGRGYRPFQFPPPSQVMHANFDGNGFAGAFTANDGGSGCTSVMNAPMAGQGNVISADCSAATPTAAAVMANLANTELPFDLTFANYDLDEYVIANRDPSVFTFTFRYEASCGNTAQVQLLDASDKVILDVRVMNGTYPEDDYISINSYDFAMSDMNMTYVMPDTFYTVECRLDNEMKNVTGCVIVGGGMMETKVVDLVPFVDETAMNPSKITFNPMTACENYFDDIKVWDALALTFEEQYSIARMDTAATNANPYIDEL